MKEKSYTPNSYTAIYPLRRRRSIQTLAQDAGLRNHTGISISRKVVRLTGLKDRPRLATLWLIQNICPAVPSYTIERSSNSSILFSTYRILARGIEIPLSNTRRSGGEEEEELMIGATKSENEREATR